VQRFNLGLGLQIPILALDVLWKEETGSWPNHSCASDPIMLERIQSLIHLSQRKNLYLGLHRYLCRQPEKIMAVLPRIVGHASH
jgi:hypothetical protein